MEKPVASSLSFMFTCQWKMLSFESEDTEVFKADRHKLFASNDKQIDTHTLMLVMLYSNMSVLCTYHCIGSNQHFKDTDKRAYSHVHPPQSCQLIVYLAFQSSMVYTPQIFHFPDYLFCYGVYK